MARTNRISKLVVESAAILSALGIPMTGLTVRRREKMAKAFLAVAGMTPSSTWASVRSDNKLRSRDVIDWMNLHFGEDISSGSYDDIRRKDLLLPVTAGLVLKSAGKDGAATNDGTRAYALSPETADLLRFYGNEQWDVKLAAFNRGRDNLAEQLKKTRLQQRIPIQIGSEELLFGPGEHNELQKSIIEDFLPNFGHGAKVLYVGDTEDKDLFIDRDALNGLGFFNLSHEELPDVVAYSQPKNWLFVIEAVHSANPITELRKRSLEQLTASCSAAIVYVTVFSTRDSFRRFSSQVAWETEVWIVESPHHLIHFNGDKFLGPYTAKLG